MKNLSLSVLVIILIVSTSFSSAKKSAQQVTLTSVKYSFYTTNSDKEWDTQVGAQVIFDSRTIAENFCCNIDKKKDRWKPNSDGPQLDMLIHEHLSKFEFNQASFVASSRASGNDKWEFDLRIHAEFSDHTEENWTILSQTLNSLEGKRAINTYTLSDGKKSSNSN